MTNFSYNFVAPVSFRGRTYQCKANIQGPEPSVGILGPWVDDFMLEGFNGDMFEYEADDISNQIEDALMSQRMQ